MRSVLSKQRVPGNHDGAALDWIEHTHEIRPWQQQGRAGTRADRELTHVEVSLPPKIAHAPVTVPTGLVAQMESALREVARLDSEHGEQLGALNTLLIRTESVASSKIEQIEASIDDYARALYGSKANTSAVSMVAATQALAAMVESVGERRVIDLDDLTLAHRRLMETDDNSADRAYAGRVRDMQNWIGGSDHSPLRALYVPPPPETLEAYLDDLVAFVNRDDVPVIAQAAIAHAQFESIHPFTDGNGRIGRILINSVLRRRGATTHVVVPLASALVAHRDRYFDLLGEHRQGHSTPLQATFTRAMQIAAGEARATAARLAEIPQQWREQVIRLRRGSTAATLLELLLANPVLSADDACALLPGSDSAVYAALDRLNRAEVIRPLTPRVRNQVWGAGAVLDELEDLGHRIAAAAQ